MSLGELAIAVCIGGGTLLAWRNALRARERAIGVCRRLCRSYELQLLDDTVALATARPVFDRRSGLAVRRVYSFEFSRDGSTRESGSVTVLGGEILAFYLPEDPQLT